MSHLSGVRAPDPLESAVGPHKYPFHSGTQCREGDTAARIAKPESRVPSGRSAPDRSFSEMGKNAGEASGCWSPSELRLRAVILYPSGHVIVDTDGDLSLTVCFLTPRTSLPAGPANSMAPRHRSRSLGELPARPAVRGRTDTPGRGGQLRESIVFAGGTTLRKRSTPILGPARPRYGPISLDFRSYSPPTGGQPIPVEGFSWARPA